MTPSLTVVLPVHNAEAALEQNLRRVIDLASDLTKEFGVLVIDDGSTDDTFDIARELAARYPQIRVMRNSSRRGLGPTLKRLHARLRSEVVIVHDGTSQVNVEEIRSMWINRRQRIDRAPTTINDLRSVATTHAAMVRAHNRVAGFQLLSTLVERAPETATLARELSPRQAAPARGVGVIPLLPQNNLYQSITEFALGE